MLCPNILISYNPLRQDLMIQKQWNSLVLSKRLPTAIIMNNSRRRKNRDYFRLDILPIVWCSKPPYAPMTHPTTILMCSVSLLCTALLYQSKCEENDPNMTTSHWNHVRRHITANIKHQPVSSRPH